MKKRILAWLLIFCLLAVPLAGCGDKAEEQAQSDGQTQPAFLSGLVYQAEYLDMDVGDSHQFQGVAYDCISGPYVFFCEQYPDSTGDMQSNKVALFRMDLETGEIVQLDDPELPEGDVSSMVPCCMAAGPDGTFWLGAFTNVLIFNDDTQSYSLISKDESLCQYDADGQLLKTVPVSGLTELAVQQLLVDEAGNFYLNTFDTLYLFDPEGKQLAELPHEGITTITIYQLSAGEIGLFDNGTFHLIDPAASELGEAVPLPDSAVGVYPGIQDYTYLYEDGQENLYGYKSETGESELLLNWGNCDVDRSLFTNFSVLEDGRVAAITSEGAWGAYRLLLLNLVDPSTVPQKQELTLACLDAGQSGIRSDVVRFNQSHSDVKIVIEDYAQYNTSEDSSAGLTRLRTEMLAGNMPDLLVTEGMPVQQLAAQDMLVDLWPLIDSDGELSRDDLMTHLFDVMSIDGKLYQTASSFSIWTAAGSADVLGGQTSWTAAELMDLLETMPDGATIFEPYTVKLGAFLSGLRLSIDSFIDWEAQTCSFDSPEFIEMLNFANTFPAQYDGAVSDTAYERFQAGTQLLLPSYISSLLDIQLASLQTGGNPCFVGYPSTVGSSSGLVARDGLAITAACTDLDAAWDFLRTLLTAEYQTQHFIVGFPTNLRAFEACMKESMKKDKTVSYWISDAEIQLKGATQEDYDMFMQLYESCNGLYTSYDMLFDIIEAEAAPFFDGQKTAEEAAALIQNRIGLYLMEQE